MRRSAEDRKEPDQVHDPLIGQKEIWAWKDYWDGLA